MFDVIKSINIGISLPPVMIPRPVMVRRDLARIIS